MREGRRIISRCLGLSAALMLCACILGAQVHSPARLVPTTTQSPDEFGTQDYTVTVIPAESFTADAATGTDHSNLFRWLGDPGDFYAGVSIPSGAIVDFIGLETFSHNANEWSAELFYLDRYSGTTSGLVAISSSAHGDSGYDSDYNASALGWQLDRNVHNALVLDVAQLVPFFGGGFGWVEIWWRRAVSPAPATATFSDVPTTDPAFQFVEALAASGITAGCGGGNYCPDAPLTRRQMAVFLSKALGLRWPY